MVFSIHHFHRAAILSCLLISVTTAVDKCKAVSRLEEGEGEVEEVGVEDDREGVVESQSESRSDALNAYLRTLALSRNLIDQTHATIHQQQIPFRLSI